jgi:hypothetical protein
MASRDMSRRDRKPPKEQGHFLAAAGSWSWSVATLLGGPAWSPISDRTLFLALGQGRDHWRVMLELPLDGPRLDNAKAQHLLHHARRWAFSLRHGPEARVLLIHDEPIAPAHMLQREAHPADRIAFAVPQYGEATVPNESHVHLADLDGNAMQAWAAVLMATHMPDEGRWPQVVGGDDSWRMPESWSWPGGTPPAAASDAQ